MIIPSDYGIIQVKIQQSQSGQVQDPRPGDVLPASIQKVIRTSSGSYYWYKGSIQSGTHVTFDVIDDQAVNVKPIP